MNKLISGLFEEYKLVQNKIDKIADFELKVRGWCITIESALIVTLLTGKIAISSFYIITLILFIILVFQFLEQEQLETKKILSKRALDVEHALDRLVVNRDENDFKKKSINENIFKLLKGSPRTAIELKNFGRNRTINSFKNMFVFKNHIFYYAQYLIIATMIVLALFGKFQLSDSSTISNKNDNKFSFQKPQCFNNSPSERNTEGGKPHRR
jgi:hypothetical protein